jgi:hypothetical protein
VSKSSGDQKEKKKWKQDSASPAMFMTKMLEAMGALEDEPKVHGNESVFFKV